IPGATADSYTASSADVSETMRVLERAANVAGATTAASAVTESVAAEAPVAGDVPVVAGWPEAGEAPPADEGAGAGTGAPQPPELAYQWQRCDLQGLECVDLAGATASTYVPTEDDVGSTLRATVSATNDGGTVSATSVETLRIASGLGFSSRQQWPYVAGVAR